MYTHSMETIYLSQRAQVAVGTYFMKSSVHESWLTSYGHGLKEDLVFKYLGLSDFWLNKKNWKFRYRPFHTTLPRSSAFVNWISVRFYETDCIWISLNARFIIPYRYSVFCSQKITLGNDAIACLCLFS